MIRKERGEYICECTDCGERMFGGIEEDFRAFVESVKNAGWQIKNNGGEWEHLCPECQQ